MKRILLAFMFLPGFLLAQNPPAIGSFVNAGTGWEPQVETSTDGAVNFTPPAQAMYCYNTTLKKWVPCTGSGGGGGGAVSAVSNSDGTITFSPTTGAVVGSLNLAHSNTWTSNQNFTTISATGSIAGVGFMGVAGGSNFPSIPSGEGVYAVSGNGNSRITLQETGATTGNQRATFEFSPAIASLGFRNEQTGVGTFAITYSGGAATGITGITSNSGSGSWAHTGTFSASGAISSQSGLNAGTIVTTKAFAANARTVTAATDQAASNDYTILCNTTTNPIAETLPASPTSGQIITIKKAIDTANVNACTVGGGGFQIDGGTTVTLQNANKFVTVQFFTNAWYIIGQN